MLAALGPSGTLVGNLGPQRVRLRSIGLHQLPAIGGQPLRLAGHGATPAHMFRLIERPTDLRRGQRPLGKIVNRGIQHTRVRVEERSAVQLLWIAQHLPRR